MMNYKEAPNVASQADQQKFATGIARMASLAERLHSQGKLPERFAPEPSRLHPSLEEKVRQETITIGGKSKQDLESELDRASGIQLTDYARSMIRSDQFTTLPNPEQIDLAILQVLDLGIKKVYPTTAEIHAWVGGSDYFDFVPAEVGPHYRLQNGNQPQGEVLFMGMKPIADSDGYPRVFAVEHAADGLWLHGYWARPDDEWSPDDRLVLGFRKSS